MRKLAILLILCFLAITLAVQKHHKKTHPKQRRHKIKKTSQNGRSVHPADEHSDRSTDGVRESTLTDHKKQDLKKVHHKIKKSSHDEHRSVHRAADEYSEHSADEFHERTIEHSTKTKKSKKSTKKNHRHRKHRKFLAFGNHPVFSPKHTYQDSPSYGVEFEAYKGSNFLSYTDQDYLDDGVDRIIHRPMASIFCTHHDKTYVRNFNQNHETKLWGGNPNWNKTAFWGEEEFNPAEDACQIVVYNCDAGEPNEYQDGWWDQPWKVVHTWGLGTKKCKQMGATGYHKFKSHYVGESGSKAISVDEYKIYVKTAGV